MSELITETTDATFEADVLQSDLPVLLDLWAPWCGPCLALAPMLEQIATQYEGRVRVVKYNVDENEGGFKRFNVRSIPTLLVFRDGAEIARSAGITATWLNSVLDAAQRNVQPGQAATLRGFGGDAARKAQCLAVLKKAIDSGRLARPESGAAATNGDQLPSRHVVPEGGVDYSTALGVPAALAVLHDSIFESLPADGSNTRFALDWVEAIPVGADLTGVPDAYVQWVMHDPVWGLEQFASSRGKLSALCDSSRGELNALWDQIVEHRGQKLADATLADASWNALNDRCTEMRGVLEEGSLGQYICDCLADIIKFFRNSDGLALEKLSASARAAQMGEVGLTWWTEAERALITSHNSEIKELSATLGTPPQEPGDARDAFMKRGQELISPVRDAFLTAHPVLAEKSEAQPDAIRERSDATMTAQRQHLLELLRASRPGEQI